MATVILAVIVMHPGRGVVLADLGGLGCASVHKQTGHPPDRSLSWTHPDR
jgi:hypothetical protein